MVAELKLKKRGRMGFSDEDYAEWLRRKIERREDIQAHEMALGRQEEAGLGARQEARFGFERPEQAARIGEIGARTGEVKAGTARAEYGLGFEKSLEGMLKDIVGQKKTLGKLDIDVLTQQLKGLTPSPEAAPGVARPEPTTPTGVAKPKRKLRPSVERFLHGTPTRRVPGVIPGLLSPITGFTNIGKWLEEFTKKGIEWAYPKTR